MPVLVVYASKHGATGGIAERIAAKLTEEGYPAQALSVQEASGLEGYDAFVIGSATYGFH
jgi:menaquinone-dependent protoporphyrinogen oxidase